MNKEVKELIDTIEQLLAEYSPNTTPFDLDEYEVEYSQLRGLLDYINQLETNRDELKKWLKEIQQEEFDINGFTGVCTEIRIECILDKIEELESGKK